jgi:hypothetical protein
MELNEMDLRAILTVCALAAALAACATGDTEPRVKGAAQFADDPRLGEATNSVCFASRLNGFSDTTRDTAVLDFGRKHYLVEVFGACTKLRRAMAIGVDNNSGCMTRGDHLVVSDTVFVDSDSGLGPQRCAIKAIYDWDPKAEAAEDVVDAEAN